MHKASIVLAAGADFRLLGPHATMLGQHQAGRRGVRGAHGLRQEPDQPRASVSILLDAGLSVALVRHPMPYGDLEAMRVQRFATLADIDASHPTVEEREEYEAPVELGMVMYAGVDYGEILAQAAGGGRRDHLGRRQQRLPVLRARTCMITVADPLRPGHELTYHPGEVNLRMADVVVVNKVDSAEPARRRSAVERRRRARQPERDGRLRRVAGRRWSPAPTSPASACS